MDSAWELGFELDRRWHRLRGEVEGSKKPALLELARVLVAHGSPWALIGGLAVQLHRAEPRTTLDIDVAIIDRGGLPRRELERAGFRWTGDFPHSENWLGPGQTPVQFTDDPALHEAIRRAEARELEGVGLRVIRAADLLHAKLRAAADPARRRSKRLQDLADAQGLVEQDAQLDGELTAAERGQLQGTLGGGR
ncbi:MAG: hypothetical protein ACYCWW_10050 [Deltaproteobacteria bacterium]